MAISVRRSLDESVTDTLIEYGNQQVIGKLAGNAGAHFSEQGYARMIDRSDGDQSLFEKLGIRLDIPIHIFRQLLARATEAVRARLLQMAPPERQDEIQSLLASISSETLSTAESSRDFTKAQALIARMCEEGRFNQMQLVEFAKAGRYAETIAGLACLCEAPTTLIERMFNDGRNETMLIPCKAAGLSWLTLRALLTAQGDGRAQVEEELQKAKSDYLRLSQATAQRVLRFWCTEHALRKSGNGAVQV